MMATARPLPDVNDAVSAPFWAAAREERLAVQQCGQCSALRWQPAPICPECWTPGGAWVDLSGSGTVWSYAVYHRAMNPGFGDMVPYTVAMIELDEGIGMIGMMLTNTPDLQIGDPVRVVFEHVTPDVTVVRWERTEVAT